ncbi:hypothetical protein RFI_22595 [Reticulomyxa filosa]|uniref:Uncharacterized protein n=1 Tax=Reticulomyxa filosa TaxID=46433 RepID=X6ML79_RETFI|nr:hypothetical protein RFI_22595 [Reticulomyxa filosa]|eukprot:ETO14773.1 hypothetical protein RFI_22595 [Reticulomyxa filosa]
MIMFVFMFFYNFYYTTWYVCVYDLKKKKNIPELEWIFLLQLNASFFVFLKNYKNNKLKKREMKKGKKKKIIIKKKMEKKEKGNRKRNRKRNRKKKEKKKKRKKENKSGRKKNSKNKITKITFLNFLIGIVARARTTTIWVFVKKQAFCTIFGGIIQSTVRIFIVIFNGAAVSFSTLYLLAITHQSY